jgi:putative two-component system response regulator
MLSDLDQGHVLVVSRGAPTDLAASLLSEPGWRCRRAWSPTEALRALREDPSFDLVLIASGRDLSVFLELCRSVKFDVRFSFVSVVFVMGDDSASEREKAFEAGADDCIPAGASVRENMLRLRKAVHLKRATDSLEDSQAVIEALATAVEGKDRYTCGHVERVAEYSMELGRRLKLGGTEMTILKTGGVVHDIGKVGVPDHILNKPGKLDDEEFAIMRRHPAIGHDILKPLRTFHAVLPVVRWHHERPNGRGYPDGLGGDDLPILPRIVAVADCFDAMSTDRPYRPAMPLEKCRAILLQNGECGDLDGDLVKLMLEIIDASVREERIPRVA